MASLQTIFKSPYYFGEISLEETKSILLQEPPKSYLFRKLNNGTVTLATLRDEQLLEVEVKNCNCEGTIISIERFKSLEEFLQYCNRINNFYISLDPKIAYEVPVARKNPFSLEEMTRFCVAERYKDSINELIIPKMIKKNSCKRKATKS